jgi:fimbrial chaperone protein
MSRNSAVAAAAFIAASVIGSAEAQSLKLTPLAIDLPPGAPSAVLTMESDKAEGVAVQARVFRWSMVDGADKLEKTEDVIVSPPMLNVRAGVQSSVRVVRVSKTPVAGEETYRILFDEIPDRKSQQSGAVAILVRQSVPVFFAGIDARPGSITWKAIERDHKLVIEAANGGQKHVKVRTLSVTDDKNRDLLKDGWGYVLNGQAKRWELQADAIGARTLSVKGESESGPISTSLAVGKGG